jgi:hypothetical protein
MNIKQEAENGGYKMFGLKEKQKTEVESSSLVGVPVVVEEEYEREASYKCPGCGKDYSHASVFFPKGLRLLRCWVCTTKIEYDKESGQWRTINSVRRKPGTGNDEHPRSFEEVPDGETGIVVQVQEHNKLIAYGWSCPHCHSGAGADMRLHFEQEEGRRSRNAVNPSGQSFFRAGEFKDEENGYRTSAKPVMKCFSCRLLITQETDGRWTVYKDGSPEKKFKPVERMEKKEYEIYPEIVSYVRWVCKCGTSHRIDLPGPGDDEEGKTEVEKPIKRLHCSNCHATAFKKNGHFMMLYPLHINIRESNHAKLRRMNFLPPA